MVNWCPFLFHRRWNLLVQHFLLFLAFLFLLLGFCCDSKGKKTKIILVIYSGGEEATVPKNSQELNMSIEKGWQEAQMIIYLCTKVHMCAWEYFCRNSAYKNKQKQYILPKMTCLCVNFDTYQPIGWLICKILSKCPTWK